LYLQYNLNYYDSNDLLAWDSLGEAEKDRGKALRDNLLRLKEILRKEFAGLANDFYVWVTGLKGELLQENSGAIQDQLNALNEKAENINSDSRLSDLEAANKRLEEAHIEEVTQL
jgi:hypothetical protein